mmetsp:Transcript_12330/g.13641  ORF Transcript_12330/g.13641 Transcript_12330/m.13641 type:complete len:355 (+) Transcript_12330:153-1217(+)
MAANEPNIIKKADINRNALLAINPSVKELEIAIAGFTPYWGSTCNIAIVGPPGFGKTCIFNAIISITSGAGRTAQYDSESTAAVTGTTIRVGLRLHNNIYLKFWTTPGIPAGQDIGGHLTLLEETIKSGTSINARVENKIKEEIETYIEALPTQDDKDDIRARGEQEKDKIQLVILVGKYKDSSALGSLQSYATDLKKRGIPYIVLITHIDKANDEVTAAGQAPIQDADLDKVKWDEAEDKFDEVVYVSNYTKREVFDRDSTKYRLTVEAIARCLEKIQVHGVGRVKRLADDRTPIRKFKEGTKNLLKRAREYTSGIKIGVETIVIVVMMFVVFYMYQFVVERGRKLDSMASEL